jgi:hypothetical protein
VAGAAPPAAGAPSGGAPAEGFDGVTVVPPGDSVSPVALVPPVVVCGPAGTFGAPGSEDVGDAASGDGVVNDGTGRVGAPLVTLCVGDVPVDAGAGVLPVGEALVAAAVPDGGVEVVVPGAVVVAAPDVVAAPGSEPIAVPVPGAGIAGGCIWAGSAGSALVCARATVEAPALRDTTVTSRRTILPMIPRWIAEGRRETSCGYFNVPRSRSWPSCVLVP